MKYLQKFNESLNANPESELPFETIKDYFTELLDNYDVEIEDIKEDYNYAKNLDGDFSISSIRSNGYNYYYRNIVVNYQSSDKSPIKLLSLSANIQKDLVDIISRLESLDMTFIDYKAINFDNEYKNVKISLEFIHPINDESTLIISDEISTFISYLKRSILSLPNSIIKRSKFIITTKDNKVFIECPEDSNVNANTVKTLKKALESNRGNNRTNRRFLYDFDVKKSGNIWNVTIENISKNERYQTHWGE
jgi:hypothetical protein